MPEITWLKFIQSSLTQCISVKLYWTCGPKYHSPQVCCIMWNTAHIFHHMAPVLTGRVFLSFLLCILIWYLVQMWILQGAFQVIDAFPWEIKSRLTASALLFVYALRLQTNTTGTQGLRSKEKSTGRQTDRRTLPSALSPCFAKASRSIIIGINGNAWAWV